MGMDYRVSVLSRKCRNRGGDCPCSGPCQAVKAIEDAIGELRREQGRIAQSIDDLKKTRTRLSMPMATLRDGFKFDDRYTPIMVFDGDEATFGYEDADGEWIEANVWPFNEPFVWYDDCERLGIRVE